MTEDSNSDPDTERHFAALKRLRAELKRHGRSVHEIRDISNEANRLWREEGENLDDYIEEALNPNFGDMMTHAGGGCANGLVSGIVLAIVIGIALMFLN